MGSIDDACYGFSVATQAENHIVIVEASKVSLKTYSSTSVCKTQVIISSNLYKRKHAFACTHNYRMKSLEYFLLEIRKLSSSSFISRQFRKIFLHSVLEDL